MRRRLVLSLTITALFGTGFNGNIPVTSSSGSKKMPDITVGADSTVYVIWLNGTDLIFSKSTDHGLSFSGEVQINDVSKKVVAIQSSGPKIAESDGILYVVWPDERDGYSNTNIYFSKSSDKGSSWSTPVAVGDGFRFNLYPEIKTDPDGNVHLFYYAYSQFTLEFQSVQYRKSSDQGNSFSPPSIVNNYSDGEPCECCPADILFFPDGKQLIAFRNNRNDIRDIFGIWSQPGTSNWSDVFQISFQNYYINYCPSSGPSLGMNGNSVAVSYMVGVNDIPKVFLKVSHDNAQTFGDSIALDVSASADVSQNYPSLVVTQDDRIHVVWQDARGGSDIYYGSMLPNDGALADIQVVNDDAADKLQSDPRMVTDMEGNLFVVWADRREGSQIYLATNHPATVSVDPQGVIPEAFVLEPNYPNPFNPSTAIRYRVPVTSSVRVTIYDILGQEIRTLVNSVQDAGTYTKVWDGTDEQGQIVAGGIYLVRLSSPTQLSVSTRKMIYLK